VGPLVSLEKPIGNKAGEAKEQLAVVWKLVLEVVLSVVSPDPASELEPGPVVEPVVEASEIEPEADEDEEAITVEGPGAPEVVESTVDEVAEEVEEELATWLGLGRPGPGATRRTHAPEQARMRTTETMATVDVLMALFLSNTNPCWLLARSRERRHDFRSPTIEIQTLSE